MKTIFAIERLARESGLSKRELSEISKRVREEFPNDQLMRELHLIRAIKASKKWARTSIKEFERESEAEQQELYG